MLLHYAWPTPCLLTIQSPPPQLLHNQPSNLIPFPSSPLSCLLLGGYSDVVKPTLTIPIRPGFVSFKSLNKPRRQTSLSYPSHLEPSPPSTTPWVMAIDGATTGISGDRLLILSNPIHPKFSNLNVHQNHLKVLFMKKKVTGSLSLQLGPGFAFVGKSGFLKAHSASLKHHEFLTGQL